MANILNIHLCGFNLTFLALLEKKVYWDKHRKSNDLSICHDIYTALIMAIILNIPLCASKLAFLASAIPPLWNLRSV